MVVVVGKGTRDKGCDIANRIITTHTVWHMP